MFLTVFTPTYNRGYILERLYQSLCRQTSNDFEWLVVDDGSQDETEQLVKKWIDEKKIVIRYIKKANGGKPSAYNVAVKEAKGDYFTCVDSDDYLVNTAVEIIKRDCFSEKEENIIGQIYYKYDCNESSLSVTKYNGTVEYASLLDFYRRYGLQGETMLVYKTSVVNKYLFPVFDGEKFVPESYIYDLYDKEGLLHMRKEKIYVFEYLADGYTASIRKLNCKNPKGYEAFIVNRLEIDTEVKDFFLDMIRYIAIKFVLKDRRKIISSSKKKLLTILAFPLGWMFYIKSYMRYM